ncbi:nicotinate-nucleotide diphosphorylase (carboxylating) [candidate division WOR-1 bacterium RIFOXYA12_FULL_43_27]|uniref:Probable nicotinate-nucleotide pyrophosphorylase [carboxylating] n=1 Tax=candidate division WOR-1 bacterium RIFOXYC2_FULL_46_14 TaxID=1802587 RepID=A0A1F4U511_UNCSA|nr:MAG: nicotinate-nucleotide diphosphorylase (carboxylating) [candidate division WOR-1 bacterium RIFOXYA12_FULL_43_27]OGC20968.1 MAG: nicotinate-nucleotide diphosphorylase (carboxylating) [candidate division WOR-1 bacterium RIFOXYB2_FULL_46_45]OGC32272.1 MAG: nicotinate-nucleotide diphosphorylase (carboxylating) [candidate division WOR-1 bacterium RIFOXYA2_FULL_46_56]OGC40026.1 MAG: nicotinate-nucleotide diphosphorylase (carboxylating) [candidate division WOR-1 bacterium RIFOXYC2_FULL_46_14]
MTNKSLNHLIKKALEEDVGSGDITTNAIVPENKIAKAKIIAKEEGIIAGLPLAKLTYEVLDKKVRFISKVKDGCRVKSGTVIAEISGPARAILTGERLALNFLQHLSGIATLTNKFKAQSSKCKNKVEILDTRKTMPLWRGAEKYAVACGGGTNHRMGLYDAILIKDNHIAIAGGIEKAICKAQAQAQAKVRIEVEAKRISEVKEAIKIGVDRILLDNMNIKTLKQAVALCKKSKIKTEASGGVNLKNVAAIAKTGVDYISIGALTHSAKALDISLIML